MVIWTRIPLLSSRNSYLSWLFLLPLSICWSPHQPDNSANCSMVATDAKCPHSSRLKWQVLLETDSKDRFQKAISLLSNHDSGLSSAEQYVIHHAGFEGSVGNVLLVTRQLIWSSAYKSWQSMMVSHRAVDQLIPICWSGGLMLIDESQLFNCYTGYHNGLSGLICRALSQPPSYKETFSFRGKKYIIGCEQWSYELGTQ